MIKAPMKQISQFAMKPLVIASFTAFIIFSFLYLDPVLANYFHALNLSFNFPLLNYITHLGLGGLYLPTFLSLAIYFRYIKRNKEWEAKFWFLFTAVLLPCLICLFLKIVLGRARPVLLFDEQLYGFFGFKMQSDFWSFPSGHTTTIMSAAFALSVVFPRFFYVFISFGLVVASSRILLTSHYLSDVLVAAYLSLVEIGFILCVLRRKSWLTPMFGHTV